MSVSTVSQAATAQSPELPDLPPLHVLSPTISVPEHGPRLQLLTAKRFEWTVARFPVRGLPDELNGIRLLHLSDLRAHGGWVSAFEHLIQRTIDNPPDMILFTGDFVDNRFDYRTGLPTVQKLMNRLQSRLGAFAILGNHDGDLIAPALAGLNITLIDHRQVCLHAGNAILELIGLTGVEREDLDAEFMHSIGPRPRGAFRIVLAHYPDTILRSAFLHPDLYLCGHSHGGQVCLPRRYPIMRHDSLPRRLCSGINQAHGTWMIANRGLGFSSRFRLRLFCPAEAIEIQLTKTS